MKQSANAIFAYHDLIEAIATALERRDIHTLHHSRRVSDMTERVCRKSALSGTDGVLR